MRKIIINKEKLKELYVDKKLSSIKCASFLKCDLSTIIERLREYNISVRTISEANKGKKYPNRKRPIPFTEGHRRKIGEFNKNKIISEKTRYKISKTLMGNTNALGAERSEEIRRKYSESKKGKKNPMYNKRGEYCPNWKGGISFEPYPVTFNRELKELIRQRDNYQCQLCGMPEIENIEKLSIHHIDYNKKDCLPSNLISLCRRCNAKVNYNREYWEEYFKRILV